MYQCGKTKSLLITSAICLLKPHVLLYGDQGIECEQVSTYQPFQVEKHLQRMFSQQQISQSSSVYEQEYLQMLRQIINFRSRLIELG